LRRIIEGPEWFTHDHILGHFLPALGIAYDA
jgi:hypothetical protein